MTSSRLLPLALLYTESRSAVDGATRFQKLVFLSQEETELPDDYPFHAANYGPYSYDLDDNLKLFRDRGLIERNIRTNAIGNEKHVFTLTTTGIQTVQRMLKKPQYEPLFEHATEIKRRFNERPLDELLRYVYAKYPEYTTETELDLDRLFDPAAESQFLDVEKREPVFLGSGPEKAIEKNSSAADFF